MQKLQKLIIYRVFGCIWFHVEVESLTLSGPFGILAQDEPLVHQMVV